MSCSSSGNIKNKKQANVRFGVASARLIDDDDDEHEDEEFEPLTDSAEAALRRYDERQSHEGQVTSLELTPGSPKMRIRGDGY